MRSTNKPINWNLPQYAPFLYFSYILEFHGIIIAERVIQVLCGMIALIPAYKPDAILLELAQALHLHGCSVIIVDDGSGKEYMPLFCSCRAYAEVLHHEQNAGKGRALKTGLAYISRYCSKNCAIVTMDADGQHLIDDALAVCALAQDKPGTLALGSRVIPKDAPLRSRFGNAVTRWIFRLSTGVGVHDTQTGLRAFTPELIAPLLNIPGERYEFEMNVLLQFAKDRIPIIEHPIQPVYLNNNASSHFHAIRDSFRIYKEIIKFSLSSIVGFLVDYGLYSLLLLLGCGLTVSNIMARLVSAAVNFTLNKKFVFGSTARLLPAALRYTLLAVLILAGNTLFLHFLCQVCNVHQLLAKLITEVLFFSFSWLFQHFFVFPKGGDRN